MQTKRVAFLSTGFYEPPTRVMKTVRAQPTALSSFKTHWGSLFQQIQKKIDIFIKVPGSAIETKKASLQFGWSIYHFYWLVSLMKAAQIKIRRYTAFLTQWAPRYLLPIKITIKIAWEKESALGRSGGCCSESANQPPTRLSADWGKNALILQARFCHWGWLGIDRAAERGETRPRAQEPWATTPQQPERRRRRIPRLLLIAIEINFALLPFHSCHVCSTAWRGSEN